MLLIKKLTLFFLVLISSHVIAQSDLDSKRNKSLTQMNNGLRNNNLNESRFYSSGKILFQDQSVRDLLKAGGIDDNANNIIAMEKLLSNPSELEYYVENNLKMIRNNPKMMESLRSLEFEFIKFEFHSDVKTYNSYFYRIRKGLKEEKYYKKHEIPY